MSNEEIKKQNKLKEKEDKKAIKERDLKLKQNAKAEEKAYKEALKANKKKGKTVKQNKEKWTAKKVLAAVMAGFLCLLMVFSVCGQLIAYMLMD